MPILDSESKDSRATMKFVVGLDGTSTPEAVEALAEAGADGFFAGFVPPEWSETYGWEVSPNRRAFGPQCQFTAYDDLRAAIDSAHALDRPVAITLNAHEYTEEQMPLLREVVAAVDQLDPDAYIVASPLLIPVLREWGFDRPLHLSTGTACYNSETVRYFCGLGNVRKVVLPRKMSLREMEELIGGLSGLGVEFEAMVIGYRCFFNDELCFGLHSGVGSSLCADFLSTARRTIRRLPSDWKARLQEMKEHPAEQFEEGSALDRFRKELLRVRVPEERGRPPFEDEGGGEGMSSVLASSLFCNCGLCAIPALGRVGVGVLKVPTRGAPWQVERYVRAVRAVLDHPSPTLEFCRSLINSPGYCAEMGSCYYHLEEESADGQVCACR